MTDESAIRHTEDNDVENQDDESNDATAGTVLPCITVTSSGDLTSHRGGESESGQTKLDEDGKSVLEHCRGICRSVDNRN